jgi:hypothetical protein
MLSSPLTVGLSAPDFSSQPDRTGCIQTDRLTIVRAWIKGRRPFVTKCFACFGVEIGVQFCVSVELGREAMPERAVAPADIPVERCPIALRRFEKSFNSAIMLACSSSVTSGLKRNATICFDHDTLQRISAPHPHRFFLLSLVGPFVLRTLEAGFLLIPLLARGGAP